ncbi:hypothetical protein D8Y22_18920 [Salinadaptatus halalkaliphilus]|uniref:Uncharacterized protein n=1 Tax=Salinadaptatus halalkaliphilus TaxID=2419781 RepID=A0A4V3VKW7_9EURY|nr:hypothetical protein D8Y22_18920 [Salinadaptatus halalkaliphilus]
MKGCSSTPSLDTRSIARYAFDSESVRNCRRSGLDGGAGHSRSTPENSNRAPPVELAVEYPVVALFLETNGNGTRAIGLVGPGITLTACRAMLGTVVGL